jgi:hypothetical protein
MLIVSPQQQRAVDGQTAKPTYPFGKPPRTEPAKIPFEEALTRLHTALLPGAPGTSSVYRQTTRAKLWFRPAARLKNTLPPTKNRVKATLHSLTDLRRS